MSGIDWGVLVAYIGVMIGMSLWLARGQESGDDYYVGGRNLPWWTVAVSTMATQTSAISFISIPAFVALKPGGGLAWIQYELAVPLAMMFVMAFLSPFFRQLELVSVYEYLERRFDRPTRLVMSGVFLLSRGLATGVGVYASAVVLSVCLSLPIWATILIIGVVTVVYDTIGGMKAVVYSDVVQMGVLLGGLLLCIGLAVSEVGGLSRVLASFESERFVGLRPEHGLGDGASAPFWGFLVGGFFLYVSYYGVDQSQAQRQLSAPTTEGTRRSLVFNGLARFPLTLLYVLMGLAVGAVYLASPELRAAVPEGQLDYLVPQFVLQKLPAGVRGVLFSALLAAAMSSLDSALNSLSAATMRDFLEPGLGAGVEPRRVLRLSKVTTLLWGALITGFAFLVGRISTTVIEGINKVGSAFYGPILAAFMTGILSKRARGPGVVAGVAAGVGCNVALWIFMESVFWMWWNVTGLVVATLVTLGVSAMMAPPEASKVEKTTLSLSEVWKRERAWLPTHAGLVGYFVLLLLVAGYSRELLSLFV